MEFIKDILDQMQLYHYFITAYIIAVIWLIWEAKNAPVMPDEYDLPVEKKDTDFEDDYENQPFAD
jgi:hypothetical protein